MDNGPKTDLTWREQKKPKTKHQADQVASK